MSTNYPEAKRTMMLDATRPFIIGETAYLHEGDFNYLLRIVNGISEIGLDAVKFHLLFNIENYYQKGHPRINNLKKLIFSKKQWDNIFGYSKKKGIDIIALCDDVESVEYIIKRRGDVSAIEIHAFSLNDYYLLDAAAKFNGFILIGIGGSEIEEIQYAIDFLKKGGNKKIVLMYGFQAYPTRHTDINLSKMLKLKEIFKLPIGYADHTAFNDPYNEFISVMAAAMGFHILEKHYAPCCCSKRIDYESAVGKKTVLRIKELMKVALEVYRNKRLDMPDAELEYGKMGIMKKAIVARKHIKKGEKLNKGHLCFKRTTRESHLKQNKFLELIGLQALDDIEKDAIIEIGKLKKPT